MEKSTVEEVRLRLHNLLRSTGDPIEVNQLLLRIIEVCQKVTISKITNIAPILKCVRACSVHREKAIRAQALRCARYLLVDGAAVDAFMNLNMDLFIVWALERDVKYIWERTQALKLVRTIMAIDAKRLSRSVIQSVISVAESSKDDLRRSCLDIVRELVLTEPLLVAECNGMKTIISASLDPSYQDISGSLVLTLLFLLDNASTRKFLRPSVEVQKYFSVFTDTNTPTTKSKEVTRAAAHSALVTIMRSWTGILCLTADSSALRSLIDILALPNTVKNGSWAKESVLLFLFELLQVVREEDLQTRTSLDLWPELGPNLLHNYVVMVLSALLHCGLAEVLTKLAMSADVEFSSIARTLLTRVLRLAADLLPAGRTAKLHSLPVVVEAATAFGQDSYARFRAANTVSELRELELELSIPDITPPARAKQKAAKAALASTGAGGATPTHHKRHSRVPHPLSKHIERRKEDSLLRRRTDSVIHGVQVEQVAFHGDPTSSYEHYTQVVAASRLQGQSHQRPPHWKDQVIENLRYDHEAKMDELKLKTALNESGVLVTKDYKGWKMDNCMRILEGPLCTPSGLSYALTTKFVKRLCSFLKPEKKLFCSLPWSLDNMQYVRVAVQLFRVLVNSQEGSQYEFFAACVHQIISMLLREIGAPETDTKEAPPNLKIRPFSRESINSTLAREYFTLIGVLSNSPHGLAFFDKHNVISNLYKLVEDHSRDYLTRLLITNLDYSTNKRARTLLETWVKAGSRNLRKFAISHLRLLIRRQVADFWQWGIGLLAAQLQWSGVGSALASDDQNDSPSKFADPSGFKVTGTENDVALAALSVLEEACAEPTGVCLNTLITLMGPHKLVGARANNLLVTFLRTTAGLEYLIRNELLEPMMDAWQQHGVVHYVQALESALVEALNSVPGASGGIHILSDQQHNPNLVATAESTKPTPLGYGYVGPFGGFGGFRDVHPKLRSPADEYYFDRVHQLPWACELHLERATPGKPTRTKELIAEAFVQTVPCPEQGENALRTYVVAVVLDQDGQPAPTRVDADMTIRAHLRAGVGGDPSDIKAQAVCTADMRADLSPDTDTYVVISEATHVRWQFRFKDTAAKGAEPLPRYGARRRDAGPAVYLESVSFFLPMQFSGPMTVNLAPHFYGELPKTEQGATLLVESGHLEHFVHSVFTLDKQRALQYGYKPDEVKEQDPSQLRLRAALWTIAHIGSSANGFRLLQSTGIVPFISDQAKHCSTLSLRGTCMYVMGLLSRSAPGRRQLEKLGWECSPHHGAGLVVPRKFSDVIDIGSTDYAASWASRSSSKVGFAYVPLKNKDDPQLATKPPPSSQALIIIGHISNLSNGVTQKGSLAYLRKLQKMASHREYFRSATLLFEVLKLLGHYTFKLPARRYIMHDLFGDVDLSPDSLDKAFDGPFDVSDAKALELLDQEILGDQ